MRTHEGTTDRILGLCLLAAACLGTLFLGTARGETVDENPPFRVLFWNVYCKPTALGTVDDVGKAVTLGLWNPGAGSPDVMKRARLIPAWIREAAAEDFDCIVFAEAFDDEARALIVEGLRPDYPHATRVVGEDEGLEQDGGVLIVSRWPLSREAQIEFDDAGGSDAYSEKGCIYARVDRPDRSVHVFGTHLQAGTGAENRRLRSRQLAQMARFVESRDVPADEPVVFAGDFNVNAHEDDGELEAMMETLGATEPRDLSSLYSYNPYENRLAGEGKRELLDYVLLHEEHLRPLESRFEVLPVLTRQAPWTRFHASGELSDHEPVLGTFRFPWVPSHSFRDLSDECWAEWWHWLETRSRERSALDERDARTPRNTMQRCY